MFIFLQNMYVSCLLTLCLASSLSGIYRLFGLNFIFLPVSAALLLVGDKMTVHVWRIILFWYTHKEVGNGHLGQGNEKFIFRVLHHRVFLWPPIIWTGGVPGVKRTSVKHVHSQGIASVVSSTKWVNIWNSLEVLLTVRRNAFDTCVIATCDIQNDIGINIVQLSKQTFLLVYLIDSGSKKKLTEISYTSTYKEKAKERLWHLGGMNPDEPEFRIS